MAPPSTVIGATGTRGPGRPRVSEAEIVAAAIALIDEQGAQALTLRALAAHLGGSTATLYRHFDDRAALIDQVVDAVLGEVDLETVPPAADDWPERLSALATSLFDVLERHANVAPLMLERVRSGPNVDRIRERVLDVLLVGGFTPLDAVRTYTTVGRYVLGFGVQTRIDGRVIAAAAGVLVAASGDRSATAAAASAGPVSLREEFRFGLSMMIAGLQARVPR